MSDTREALEALVQTVEEFHVMLNEAVSGRVIARARMSTTADALAHTLVEARWALAATDGEVVEEDVDNGTFTFFHEDGLIVAASSDVMTAFIKAREVVEAHVAMCGPFPYVGPVLPTPDTVERFSALIRELEMLVYPERRP